MCRKLWSSFLLEDPFLQLHEPTESLTIILHTGVTSFSCFSGGRGRFWRRLHKLPPGGWASCPTPQQSVSVGSRWRGQRSRQRPGLRVSNRWSKSCTETSCCYYSEAARSVQVRPHLNAPVPGRKHLLSTPSPILALKTMRIRSEKCCCCSIFRWCFRRIHKRCDGSSCEMLTSCNKSEKFINFYSEFTRQ